MGDQKKLGEELNISLAHIKKYCVLINVRELDLIIGRLSEEEIEKIKACHLDLEIRKKIEQEVEEENRSRELELERKKQEKLDAIEEVKSLYGYDKKHYLKVLAQIKWYYNNRSKREEGYATFIDKVDFHFLGDVVKGIDPHQLREGSPVVLHINVRDLSKAKIRVSQLKPLEQEDDKFFLIYQSILPKTSRLTYSIALKLLRDKEVSSDDLETSKIKHLINDILCAQNNILFHQATIIYEINNIAHWYEDNNVKDLLFEKIREEDKYEFWKNMDLDVPYKVVKNFLINTVCRDITVLTEITARLKYENLELFFSEIQQSLLGKNESTNTRAITVLYETAKEYDIPLSTDNLDNETKFELWKKGFIDQMPIEFISEKLDQLYAEYIKDKKSNRSFYRHSDSLTSIGRMLQSVKNENDFENVLQFQLQQLQEDEKLEMFEKLSLFIRERGCEEVETITLIDKLNIYPFDIVFEELFSRKTSTSQMKHYDFECSNDTRLTGKVLYSITYSNLKNLYDRAVYELDEINTSDTYSQALYFLNLLENFQEYTEHDCKQIKEKFFSQVFQKSSSYYKLKWFIDDYTDQLDFDDALLYTALLNPHKQKRFFKKVLKEIEIGNLELNINDLKRIVTADYEINEESKKIDGEGRDFSISIILTLIEDLSRGMITKPKSIYELIARQVERPEDLLQITGFFDNCDGRTTVVSDTIYTNEGKPIIKWSKKKTGFRAHNYKDFQYGEYCDGRKAVKKDTGEASLCKKSGLEFWWCENSKCYEPCRNDHSQQEWSEYTLRDILRILNIDYDETQYEITLNVINRVNRFLKHLTCRDCKHILKPVGKSNYSFYGVSRFCCDNGNCEQNENQIYLTHCLNPSCPHIIDSRDAVRCKPDGQQDSCGWYICKYCYGCCTTPKINVRKEIMNYTEQQYKCQDIGHREEGIICCIDCGTQMNEVIFNQKAYNKILTWFIENRYSNTQIVKSGQRQDSKWWFIWSQGQLTNEAYQNKLLSLKRSGFNVPDIDDKLKDSQLISEPFSTNEAGEMFECPKCNHTLELKLSEEIDLARKFAIENFHTVAIKRKKIQAN